MRPEIRDGRPKEGQRDGEFTLQQAVSPFTTIYSPIKSDPPHSAESYNRPPPPLHQERGAVTNSITTSQINFIETVLGFSKTEGSDTEGEEARGKEDSTPRFTSECYKILN